MDKSSEQEKFIGGSMFYGLRKAGTYTNIYGIYTTSNRIVGVKPNALPYVLIPVSTLGILLPFAELVSLTHFPLLFLGAHCTDGGSH